MRYIYFCRLDFPLGYSFINISQRGGEIWSVEVHIDRVHFILSLFFLFRDLSGNWWLLMGQDTRIGFWPQSLFTDLKSFATNVDWGGVVYSPPGVPKPPMGSSYFPIENSSYDAYCVELTVINEKGKTIEVDTTVTHTDNPYKVEFIQLSRGAKHIYFVLYGGPGESTHV
uniref:Neprosin PEP catalytic domain-containing protein n=1 Tax=Solanum lycopersicum TaxID=4081 RepID=A0A494GAC3_SOLLC